MPEASSTDATASFSVGPDPEHQHVFSHVIEGTANISTNTDDETVRVVATCAIGPAGGGDPTPESVMILAKGSQGEISHSLQTLMYNLQAEATSVSATNCAICPIIQRGGVRKWELHSVIDGFVPRDEYPVELDPIPCASHGADTVEHRITAEPGFLLVNNHITVPVIQLSYLSSVGGKLASALILSEWNDTSLFEQAFRSSVDPSPGSPCMVDTLESFPVIGRIRGTTGYEAFTPHGVSAALRVYAGADMSRKDGTVSICPTCSEIGGCWPSACYTPMATLCANDGEWKEVIVPTLS